MNAQMKLKLIICLNQNFLSLKIENDSFLKYNI